MGTESVCPYSVLDVAQLLQTKYAYISGGYRVCVSLQCLLCGTTPPDQICLYIRWVRVCVSLQCPRCGTTPPDQICLYIRWVQSLCVPTVSFMWHNTSRPNMLIYQVGTESVCPYSVFYVAQHLQTKYAYISGGYRVCVSLQCPRCGTTPPDQICLYIRWVHSLCVPTVSLILDQISLYIRWVQSLCVPTVSLMWHNSSRPSMLIYQVGTESVCPYSVLDVAQLLQTKYAYISGGYRVCVSLQCP